MDYHSQKSLICTFLPLSNTMHLWYYLLCLKNSVMPYFLQNYIIFLLSDKFRSLKQKLTNFSIKKIIYLIKKIKKFNI
jgi:hypothetical protein